MGGGRARHEHAKRDPGPRELVGVDRERRRAGGSVEYRESLLTYVSNVVHAYRYVVAKSDTRT